MLCPLLRGYLVWAKSFFLGQAMGKLKIGYIVTTRSCNYQNEMKKVNNWRILTELSTQQYTRNYNGKTNASLLFLKTAVRGWCTIGNKMLKNGQENIPDTNVWIRAKRESIHPQKWRGRPQIIPLVKIFSGYSLRKVRVLGCVLEFNVCRGDATHITRKHHCKQEIQADLSPPQLELFIRHTKRKENMLFSSPQNPVIAKRRPGRHFLGKKTGPSYGPNVT